MLKSLPLRLGDIILMSAILLSAILLFVLPFLSTDAKEAEIVIAESGESKIISLNEDADYEISSREVTLTVSVRDGAVSVSQSSCRDAVCKNTPKISHAGQTIVCAPAGIVIRILGEGGYVDGVVG